MSWIATRKNQCEDGSITSFHERLSKSRQRTWAIISCDCPDCNESFSSKLLFIEHLPDCPKTGVDSTKPRKTLSDYPRNFAIICPICYMCVTRASSVVAHFRAFHPCQQVSSDNASGSTENKWSSASVAHFLVNNPVDMSKFQFFTDERSEAIFDKTKEGSRVRILKPRTHSLSSSSKPEWSDASSSNLACENVQWNSGVGAFSKDGTGAVGQSQIANCSEDDPSTQVDLSESVIMALDCSTDDDATLRNLSSYASVSESSDGGPFALVENVSWEMGQEQEKDCHGGEYRCDVCRLNFGSNDSFIQHLLRFHASGPPVVDVRRVGYRRRITLTTANRCSNCSKLFSCVATKRFHKKFSLCANIAKDKAT